MDDSVATLNEAVALHRAGRFDEAATIYRRLLTSAPDDARVQLLLATACLQGGDFPEAIERFERRLETDPGSSVLHNNLGVAYKAVGRLDDAVRAFEAAIANDPAYEEALFNLGQLMHERGRNAEAEKSFRAILAANPTDRAAALALARILQSTGRHDESADLLESLATTSPDDAELLTAWGYALVLSGRFEEAVDVYRRAARLASESFQIWSNLSFVLERTSRLDEAVDAAERAVALNPESAECHNNLGSALRYAGRVREAIEAFAVAKRLRPDLALLEFNHATAVMLNGDLADGWPGFERRFELAGIPTETSPGRRWDGRDPDGLRILLTSEQGLGDTLQFVRYAKVLADRGADVILSVPPPLVELLRTTSGASEVRPDDEVAPLVDAHVPLLSVPGLVGTTVETISADVPYLHADPELVDKWRGIAECWKGIRIGLVWQGNPEFRDDRLRSAPFAEFAPLVELDDVTVVSLQKGAGIEQLEPSSPGVARLGPDYEDRATFADTAAILEHLDLVVTVDTAVVHLAGALAKPVWVALPFVPEWRWFLDRADSPWYPTVRLFRQPRPGDWAAVVREMVTALGDRLRSDAE